MQPRSGNDRRTGYVLPVRAMMLTWGLILASGIVFFSVIGLTHN